MSVAVLAVLLAASGQPSVVKLDVGGVERQYLVYAPSLKSDKHPLVFGFHGHGGNMRQAGRSFRMHETMPEAVVVYMDGLPTKGKTDPEGKKPGWQQRPGENGDRDLKFFDAVYSQVTEKYEVDTQGVFCMGHSNGGRFTYVLWSERADRFAAFAPSGSPGFAQPLAPKPFLQIAGEKDPIVSFLGQRLSVDRQKRANGCESVPASTDGPLNTYTGKAGADVWTYFHPSGHEFPQKAPALIASFFRTR